MKRFILIGLSLLLCNIVEAKTMILYCRSDTHKINTVTAYQLQPENSASGNYMAPTVAGASIVSNGWGTYNIAVSILHRDGSETPIGTPVAETTRLISYNEYDEKIEQGVQSATFSCPKTNLAVTDALKIVWHVSDAITGYSYSTTQTWISEQLKWAQLSAATWTVYRYTYLEYWLADAPGHCFTSAFSRLYYGNPTYATYINGIDYIEAGDDYAIIY